MAMNLIRIAKVADFSLENPVKSFKIIGRHVAVFLEQNGTLRAMEVGCRHQNANLLQGRREGDKVTCPWHGWQYNLKTGECLRGGTNAPLRPHHCKVENGNVFISAQAVPEGETVLTASINAKSE